MDKFIRYAIVIGAALIVLYLVVTCPGCSKNKSKEADPAPVSAQARVSGYKHQIPFIQDSYGFVGTRCDSTTFTAALLAFAPFKIAVDLYLAETEPGKWERHAVDCYATDLNDDGKPDSVSETSLEVYLMVLHRLLSMPDRQTARDELARIIAYGESNGWVMGQGPVEFTNILVLVPLIYEMEYRFNNEGNAVKELTSKSFDFDSILKGHKGHVAAFIGLLQGRITGQVETAILLFFETLAGTFPSNPIYQAMFHRFKDGDQSAVDDIVMNDYADMMDVNVGCHDWGSAPCGLCPIAAVGIAGGM